MSKSEELKSLLPYAETEKQKARLEAYIEHGSRTEACVSLGVSLNAFKRTMLQIRKKARNSGHLEDGKAFTPIEGHFIKGESALVDSKGVAKLRWIKTDTDKRLRLEVMQKAIIEAFEDYKGTSTIIPAPDNCIDDLLVFLPIGDAHLGMLAWVEDAGESWDLKIAEKNYIEAMARMIESAPNAKECLIADMGDFLHRNDNKNATPQSGNALDCDGRSIKMMRVAVKILIYAIDCALAKFETVRLRNVVGNHAPEAEQMLSLVLEQRYNNNPRVIVEQSTNKFYYYQWGETLIGLCHGDGVKHAELPMIMASDAPKMWGNTLFRYIFIGHIHHQAVKEYQGCSTESINTITPNDAWHTGAGYRSRKNIKLMVMHKKYGEIERITKDISMIRGEK